MSVIDIIDTGKKGPARFLVGETHDNGVFGQRSEAADIHAAYKEAQRLSLRWGLVIKPVSYCVQEELVKAGLWAGESNA